MKERKVKFTPCFVDRGTHVDSRGLTTMKIVGWLPKGGRVVLTLTDMPSYMVKQLVKGGLNALQTRRDGALQDVEEMRHKAAQ